PRDGGGGARRQRQGPLIPAHAVGSGGDRLRRRESAACVKREATILVVDDEAEVREVLVEYFAAQGYAALGAEHASAARASAEARAIDLALVDVHMPGEDGLSLARHLRERYASIAIVMLTSASSVVD